MACYHMSVKVVSRSGGRSAVGAAAYRSGDSLRDDRAEREHDYSRRSGVERCEVLAPDEAPAWAIDREQLWNAVEAGEKRCDAQLAREFEVALPNELSRSERWELARDWAQEQLVERGMVADVAMHSPSRHGDQRNYHAHIMTTMRPVHENGFGNKAREWNSREQLGEWRQSWERHCNRALERAGRPERVDSRSLADQRDEAWRSGDIQKAERLEGKEPGRHLGPAATAIQRRGRELSREDLRGDERGARGEGREGRDESLSTAADDRESRSQSGSSRDDDHLPDRGGREEDERQAGRKESGREDDDARGFADRLNDAIDRVLEATREALDNLKDRWDRLKDRLRGEKQPARDDTDAARAELRARAGEWKAARDELRGRGDKAIGAMRDSVARAARAPDIDRGGGAPRQSEHEHEERASGQRGRDAEPDRGDGGRSR